MIISKEEKKIDRPLLYLTGGLVLGETIALWIPAKQGCIWLAAMLSVLLYARFRKDRARLPFVLLWLSLFVFGAAAGFFRMRAENMILTKREAVTEASQGGIVSIRGTIREIEESGDGFRLILRGCRRGEETSLPVLGGLNMYCYLDSAEGLEIGQEIRVAGSLKAPEPARNPGNFDYRLYCRAKGINGTVYGVSYTVLKTGGFRPGETLRRIRGCLCDRLSMIAEEEDAGLLKAILLGEKGEIEDSLYELYRKNGIAHLLAISGLHVTVIGLGIWKLFRKGSLGFWTSGILAGAILIFYGAVVGFAPSVLRAVSMMLLAFLASAVGRTYDLPSALCVPAIFLLLARPYLITQSSFQLSFLAAGSVFFPGQFLSKRLELKGPGQAFLISASIQLVTAPVILYHSFEIPLYGIFLNLLVIPLMTYVVISGFAGLFVSFLWMSGGIGLLGSAHYILAFYEKLCRLWEKLPGYSLLLGRPDLWKIFLYYLLLTAGVLLIFAGKLPQMLDGDKMARPGDALFAENAGRIPFRTWRQTVSGAALIVLGLLLLLPFPESGLTVTFLDVGQGDGVFIRSPETTILSDCGSSQINALGERVLVPFLKSQAAGKLDYVIISHADSDHVSGIRYLLEMPDCGIAIGELVMPEAGRGEEAYEVFENLAASEGIPVRYLKKGEKLIEGERKRPEILCLYPGETNVFDGRNNESLVLRVQYGNFSLLLTGDAEAEAEKEILEETMLSPSVILKVAHHGSASSTTEDFLKKVAPSLAVISCGKDNSYGHPAPQTIERLEEQKVPFLTTMDHGVVTVRTNGRNYTVKLRN